MTEPKNAAQRAGRASIDRVMAKDREGWLALYADDAFLADPVGVSPLDPTGNGHRGKEAIARFWDKTIAMGDKKITIRESHPCADECANVLTIENTLPNGMVVDVKLVAVYRTNDDGKIVSMKAYWDFATAVPRAR